MEPDKHGHVIQRVWKDAMYPRFETYQTHITRFYGQPICVSNSHYKQPGLFGAER